MKKILVVNVNWIGDVIFSTPVFKALRNAYPNSEIVCLAVPRVREVLEMNPFLDRIIIYDEKRRHGNPWVKVELVRQLRAEKFDAAFLLHRSFTRAFLVFLAGIPKRIGYDTKGRGFLLTHRVKPLNGIVHRSDYYLQVVESFGVKADDRSCDLQSNEGSRRRMEEILFSHGIQPDDFIAVVNPGGNWDLKRWPKENFSGLIDRLARECQAKVVIPGAGKDIKLAHDIAAKTQTKPVVLAGQSSLKELAALLERARIVISADSGPLHLAGALGTPTIGLFGPTRPEVTGPRGKGRAIVLQNDVGCNRAPCYNLGCPDNVCMQSITIDDVIHAVQQIRN